MPGMGEGVPLLPAAAHGPTLLPGSGASMRPGRQGMRGEDMPRQAEVVVAAAAAASLRLGPVTVCSSRPPRARLRQRGPMHLRGPFQQG